MFRLKNILKITIALLAMTELANAQVDVDVLVRNQRFEGDTFFFDIYLERSGTENLFLGNADFALDFEEAYFNLPTIGLKSGSTELENAYGVATSYYDTNISSKIETKGVNAYRLMIYVQMPVYSNNSDFLTRFARIDAQSLTHRIGTFYITNSIDANSNPSLSWITSGDGLVLKIKHRDSTTMAASSANITAVNPALETQPITQASGLVVDAKTGNSITLSWNSGSGSGRLLLINTGSAVPTSSYPVDGIQYLADSVYGMGDTPGDSTTYAVYSGSGNSVTVTGLSASTDYYFSLFEYNGANGWSENYASSAPATVSETTEGPYISANIKVFLQGAYSTSSGTMNTYLRMGNNYGSTNLLPSAQPYSGSPWNYSGTESVDTSAHPSTAVDWILVELRSTASGSVVSNGQAAGFLLADGSIVDTNGVDPIRFYNVNAGYYFVVVKHRNHLPVMTKDSIYLSAASSLYDFTSAGQGQAYGADTSTYLKLPMNEVVSGTYAMWAGDVNANNELRYNLASNDRVLILSKIGGSNINASVSNEYTPEDINLNRQVRYNLASNDRVIILQNIGSTNINARRQIQIP